MNFNLNRLKRIFKVLVSFFCTRLLQFFRIKKFFFLSTCANIHGQPILYQPAIFNGRGKIIFKENVKIGVPTSPSFFSSYAYFEVRKEISSIEVCNDVWINNNFCIISEGEGVKIGAGCLIGSDVMILDSDFHALHPQKRIGGIPLTGKVQIEENVFIGSRVTILKGVTIGKNSVVANGSIVSKSIPANVIAAGIPCKIIKNLDIY